MQHTPSHTICYSHRVSYGETDAMGYLYHAEYLHIFEIGRTEFLRSLGISYAEIENRGIRLPVCHATCHYRYPAHYDDILNVHIKINEIKKASLTFSYSVINGHSSKLLTNGTTRLACTNINGQLIKLPEWLINIFYGSLLMVSKDHNCS